MGLKEHEMKDVRTSVTIVLWKEAASQSDGHTNVQDISKLMAKRRMKIIKARLRSAGWNNLSEFVRALSSGEADVMPRGLK